jgi:hypothetical protein
LLLAGIFIFRHSHHPQTQATSDWIIPQKTSGFRNCRKGLK